jgi:hypothetical protein
VVVQPQKTVQRNDRADPPSQTTAGQSQRPAFLLSFCLHILLMMGLVLWNFRLPMGPDDSIRMTLSGVDGQSDSGEFQLDQPVETPEEPDQPEAGGSLELAPQLSQKNNGLERSAMNGSQSQEIGPETVGSSEGVSSALQQVSVAGTARETLFESLGTQGRHPSVRAQAAGKRGGSIASEMAVEAAVLWMAEHQERDGTWRLDLQGDACNGRCADGAQISHSQSVATGLALLTFLGAGYTHQEGPYKEAVSRGLYALIQRMKQTPHGGRFAHEFSNFAMYEQGICSLALCEAYQMTQDESLRDPCKDALRYVHYAQHSDGSWDYDPKRPGDLSIGCWQIMALKSGHMAQLPVPVDSIRVFDRYLDSVASEEGAKYGYRNRRPKVSTTAMGLLMRLYRGWPRTDPRMLAGARYVASEGPSQDDVYSNFYTTQLLFQLEGPLWENWNPKMRDFLIATQEKEGHQRGSWFFNHKDNLVGGRLYVTAIAAMTLQVYYRYLPIYQETEIDDFSF